MTGVRAFARRGLSSDPLYQCLPPTHEFAWFSLHSTLPQSTQERLRKIASQKTPTFYVWKSRTGYIFFEPERIEIEPNRIMGHTFESQAFYQKRFPTLIPTPEDIGSIFAKKPPYFDNKIIYQDEPMSEFEEVKVFSQIIENFPGDFGESHSNDALARSLASATSRVLQVLLSHTEENLIGWKEGASPRVLDQQVWAIPIQRGIYHDRETIPYQIIAQRTATMGRMSWAVSHRNLESVLSLWTYTLSEELADVQRSWQIRPGLHNLGDWGFLHGPLPTLQNERYYRVTNVVNIPPTTYPAEWIGPAEMNAWLSAETFLLRVDTAGKAFFNGSAIPGGHPSWPLFGLSRSVRGLDYDKMYVETLFCQGYTLE